jgi:hypothetical protein
VVLYVFAAVTDQVSVTLLSRTASVSSSDMSQKLQTLITYVFVCICCTMYVLLFLL